MATNPKSRKKPPRKKVGKRQSAKTRTLDAEEFHVRCLSLVNNCRGNQRQASRQDIATLVAQAPPECDWAKPWLTRLTTYLEAVDATSGTSANDELNLKDWLSHLFDVFTFLVNTPLALISQWGNALQSGGQADTPSDQMLQILFATQEIGLPVTRLRGGLSNPDILVGLADRELVEFGHFSADCSLAWTSLAELSAGLGLSAWDTIDRAHRDSENPEQLKTRVRLNSAGRVYVRDLTNQPSRSNSPDDPFKRTTDQLSGQGRKLFEYLHAQFDSFVSWNTLRGLPKGQQIFSNSHVTDDAVESAMKRLNGKLDEIASPFRIEWSQAESRSRMVRDRPH